MVLPDRWKGRDLRTIVLLLVASFAPGRAVRILPLLLVVAAPGQALGAQTLVGLHGVAVERSGAGERGPADRSGTGYLQGQVEWSRAAGEWELRIDGGVWLDLGEPSASLVAPADVTLGRAWDWGEMRIGLGEPAWGLSVERSPAAALSPDALLWSGVAGPPLAGPIVEVTAFRDRSEWQAVVLPLRRPIYANGFIHRTWDGRALTADASWEAELAYGLRYRRTFADVDAALWWMDASDRRPWVDGGPGDEAVGDEAAVRHPRTRQAGYALEWVLGPTVVRSEGGLARREGAWQTRLLAGLEWFATPWLTLLLEQGFASDRDQAASPLVDDALLGAELVAERLRLRAGLALDPGSGTLHHWSAARWTLGAQAALEAEWVDAWGAVGDESPAALRQPRAVRIGGVWFF